MICSSIMKHSHNSMFKAKVKNNPYWSILCRQFNWRDLLYIMASLGKKEINPKRPLRMSVEGNIGSGKSTFINYFKKFPFVHAYDEPLDKWRNLKGHNLLDLLYTDMSKWYGPFQSYVQLTRTELQCSVPDDGIKVQLFERSVQNNRFCFLESAYREGNLSEPEYAVLCEWYKWLEENMDISLDFIVYLRSSPDIVYERIKSRKRPEEKSISREYLQGVHDAHERWLTDPNLGIPVCVINADLALSAVKKSYDDVLPFLMQTKTTVSQVVNS